MVTPMSSVPTSGPAPSDGSARPAGSNGPGWLDELVTVLDARRRLVAASAIGLSLLGMLAAYLLPRFVPPRPLVGAAVGLAAALLAVAIAVAADQADLTVRGARHVRAAGGQLAAVLAGDPTPSAAAELAARIDARAAAGGRHWVAVAPASRGFGSVSRWADALGIALADAERRVVVIDLADGPTPGRAGVVEVVNDELRLGQAVIFDPERMLARLGPGADERRALELVTGLVPRLPADIEILVLALPALGQPGALAAAGLLDRVLVVAEADETPRVDLIASLDAVDATGTAAEVLLVERRAGDGGFTPAPATAPPADTAAPFDAPADEPDLPDEPVPAPGEGIRAADASMLTSAAPIADREPEPARRPEPEPEPAPEPAPATDHLREHGRWATPPSHQAFTGASSDVPPLLDDDDEAVGQADDDVRVTAALQTLAQEVWQRDPDER